MFIDDGVSSFLAAACISSVIALAVALRRSRQNQRRAWDLSGFIAVQYGLLMQSHTQVQDAATATGLQLEEARKGFAEEHKTVQIVSAKLNECLYELEQVTATYTLMKADLKLKAADAAGEKVARVYWEAEAKKLRGSVDELNSKIATEREAEIQSGIAEAVVAHAVSLGVGG